MRLWLWLLLYYRAEEIVSALALGALDISGGGLASQLRDEISSARSSARISGRTSSRPSVSVSMSVRAAPADL